MSHGWQIIGKVRGNVIFPEHPEHQGHWGLEGGEDITAYRDTFRSLGEAMTWCRQILDGLSHPRRWEPAGPLLTPNTGPRWFEAEVIATPARGSISVDDRRWVVVGRDWREVVDPVHERLGPPVRTDRRAATTETITPNEEYL